MLSVADWRKFFAACSSLKKKEQSIIRNINFAVFGNKKYIMIVIILEVNVNNFVSE